MACGGCGKKAKIVRTGDVSKSVKKKGVLPSTRVIKVGRKKPKRKPVSVRAQATNKCPTCGSILKKIARVGKGDMLQCVNKQCGYLRKLRK